MNIQQAIDVLNMVDAYGLADEAKKIAIEALEKCKPKEVLYSGDGYADGTIVYDTAQCPNCGTFIYDDYSELWEEPFCAHCGQALKWEVETDAED